MGKKDNKISAILGKQLSLPVPELFPIDMEGKKTGGSAVTDLSCGEQIGVGGFGAVYPVTSFSYNGQAMSNYVLKVQIKKLTLTDEHFRGCVKNEASLFQRAYDLPVFLGEELTTIKDKKIPTTWFLMRRFPGKELYEHFKSGSLTFAQILRIINLLLEEINRIHQKKILHNDLKLEQIIVDIDEKTQEVRSVKIIDFGFACDCSPGQNWKYPGSTPGVTTPEHICFRATSDKSPDPRIDPYMTAVIIAELLTNRKSFGTVTQESSRIYEALSNIEERIKNFSTQSRSDINNLLTEYKKLLTQLSQSSPNITKVLQEVNLPSAEEVRQEIYLLTLADFRLRSKNLIKITPLLRELELEHIEKKHGPLALEIFELYKLVDHQSGEAFAEFKKALYHYYSSDSINKQDLIRTLGAFKTDNASIKQQINVALLQAQTVLQKFQSLKEMLNQHQQLGENYSIQALTATVYNDQIVIAPSFLEKKTSKNAKNCEKIKEALIAWKLDDFPALEEFNEARQLLASINEELENKNLNAVCGTLNSLCEKLQSSEKYQEKIKKEMMSSFELAIAELRAKKQALDHRVEANPKDQTAVEHCLVLTNLLDGNKTKNIPGLIAIQGKLRNADFLVPCALSGIYDDVAQILNTQEAEYKTQSLRSGNWYRQYILPRLQKILLDPINKFLRSLGKERHLSTRGTIEESKRVLLSTTGLFAKRPATLERAPEQSRVLHSQ